MVRGPTMRDVYPTPPPTPSRTLEIRLSIHLPAGSTILPQHHHGETEAAAVARWITEATNAALPSWTKGPVGKALAMPLTQPPARGVVL